MTIIEGTKDDPKDADDIEDAKATKATVIKDITGRATTSLSHLYDVATDIEPKALLTIVKPAVINAAILNAAQRKPKRAGIDEWIEKHLAATPDATARELYDRAVALGREDITNPDRGGVGFERFSKRVTNARRRLGLGRFSKKKNSR